MESKRHATQLVELTRTRAGIYRLFASLYFKELSIQQMVQLSQLDLSGLQELDAGIAEGMRDVVRDVRHAHEVAREDLAVDYSHTFLAAGTTKNEKRACPYESVFTSDQGLLMQEARDEVYRYMLAEHVEPDNHLHVPEDHLSFELEFMATLCERLASAVENGMSTEAERLLTVQRAFHAEHLLNWIDDFCDAVLACCRTRFYGGVAKMTRGYVHLDADLMEEASHLLARAA